VVGTVSEPATVTVQGRPAVIAPDNSFTTTTPVAEGTTALAISATDASGNTATRQYEVDAFGSGRTFTYDANGNLTADGTRTFEWDARNQLVAVNVGTHRSEFTYDGRQRRVRLVEKENNVVQSDTKVIWCQTVICEERGTDGISVTRRLFTDGEEVGGVARFFAGDHLASVTDVTDTSGALTTRYAFDPWGRRTVTSGVATTSVGFTGHEVNTATGLSLALYRAYDPELGDWISEDPIRWEEGPNFYRYAGGNPVVFADALGLKITCVTSFQERPVSKTGCGTAGCTTPTQLGLNALPCERDQCTNTWKFDAQVTLRLLVEYAVDPNLPSKETPGSTLRQHEMLHVRDLQGWCRSLNNSVKSEGFSSRAACEAARQEFSRSLQDRLRRAGNDTRRRRDGK
jgi:RHS repeat-associated protein